MQSLYYRVYGAVVVVVVAIFFLFLFDRGREQDGTVCKSIGFCRLCDKSGAADTYKTQLGALTLVNVFNALERSQRQHRIFATKQLCAVSNVCIRHSHSNFTTKIVLCGIEKCTHLPMPQIVITSIWSIHIELIRKQKHLYSIFSLSLSLK